MHEWTRSVYFFRKIFRLPAFEMHKGFGGQTITENAIMTKRPTQGQAKKMREMRMRMPVCVVYNV